MKRTELTAKILSIPELGTVQGKLGELGKVVTDNYPDGLDYFTLADVNSGAETRYWMTGGLRGAFKLAAVTPGMMLEIVHEGKVPFGDAGQTVNSYRIYRLEN